MYDAFKKLVMERQSCREFSEKPVSEQTLREIAELAMLAPSACNSQPWRIYIVTGNDKVQAVAEAVQDKGHNKFSSSAKAFIVITDKTATLRPGTEAKFDRNHFVKYDVGELVAYLTLAAKAKGVESCIIGWINAEKLKNAVGYLDDEICNIVVALGYSDIPVREKVRKNKDEIIKTVK